MTYILTCTDSGGNQVSDSATVAVTPPVLSLSASPALIRSGGVTSISWSGGVGSCTLSGTNGYSSHALSSPVGGVPQSNIVSQTTFTFSCHAGPYNPSQTVVVKIVPSFREF
jgi:hypothetical protein